MSEKKLREEIKSMCIDVKTKLDEIISVVLGQPDKPDKPLSKGDWVKSNVNDELVYVTSLKSCFPGGFSGFTLTGNYDNKFDLSKFTSKTLEEADLPDRCIDCGSFKGFMKLVKDKDGDYWVECEVCRFKTSFQETEHNAISKALKIHIGHKLFEKAGE